jgi:hypothetical protein
MTNQPSDPSSERRGDIRRAALIECKIRNISEGGARLELAIPQLLPHTFELQIAGLPARLCNLRWAKGNLVGVQFVDAPQ